MSHNPHWNKHPVGGRPWSAEEDQKLVALREQGVKNEDMTTILCRTVEAIKARGTALKLAPRPRPETSRAWSPDEDAVLLNLLNQGQAYKQISVIIQRTRAAIKCRTRYLNFSVEQRKEQRRARAVKNPPKSEARISYHEGERAIVIPHQVIAERNHRLMAAAQRSLTSMLCGDPLPGFSALEKRA